MTSPKSITDEFPLFSNFECTVSAETAAPRKKKGRYHLMKPDQLPVAKLDTVRNFIFTCHFLAEPSMESVSWREFVTDSYFNDHSVKEAVIQSIARAFDNQGPIDEYCHSFVNAFQKILFKGIFNETFTHTKIPFTGFPDHSKSLISGFQAAEQFPLVHDTEGWVSLAFEERLNKVNLVVIRILKQIGQGGLGTVFQGHAIRSNGEDVPCAIKRPISRNMLIKFRKPATEEALKKLEQASLNDLEDEVNNLYAMPERLRHIVLMPLFHTPAYKKLIVFPLCRSDLDAYVKRLTSNKLRVQLAIPLLVMLVGLREENIVHGDIKGANVLIKNDYKIVFSDCSRMSSIGNLQFPPAYSAPYMMKTDYLQASNETERKHFEEIVFCMEQFAMSVVLFTVLSSGKLPYSIIGHDGESLKFCSGPYNATALKNYPLALQKIMEAALRFDRNARPQLEQMYQVFTSFANDSCFIEATEVPDDLIPEQPAAMDLNSQ